MDDAFARARERLAETVDVLVWKVEGLDERTVRTPLTATGLTLLGILQHSANVVLGYLGDSFGRPWSGRPSAALVPLAAIDADPMADWVVAADVPAAEVVAFAREVLVHVRATLDRGPDARGTVAWWSPSRADVSLGQVLDHTVADLLRHAGQADVLREACDGSVGISRGDTWSALGNADPSEHVARLRKVAEAAG